MNIKLKKRINQVKKSQNKMMDNLRIILGTLDLRNVEDFRLYINILNQIYFINKDYDSLENKIKIINSTLKQRKIKNLKHEIKEDNRFQANMEFYSSLVFCQNHLSGSI
jgi:hypothetical protein